MVPQIIDGVGQFITLVLGLGSFRVGQSASAPHPHSHHQGELSSIAMVSSAHIVMSKGWGHLQVHSPNAAAGEG